MNSIKICIIFLISCVNFICAQKKDICSLIKGNSVFIQDSVQSFSNHYVNNFLVGNIKNSNADIKIRVYIPSNVKLNCEIVILKCMRGVFSATKTTTFHYNTSYTPSDGVELVNVNEHGALIERGVKPLRTDFIDEQITQLLNNKLFSIVDQKTFILQMAETEKNSESSMILKYPSILVEVKRGVDFRNFRLFGTNTFYESIGEVSRFDSYKQLVNIIYSILANNKPNKERMDIEKLKATKSLLSRNEQLEVLGGNGTQKSLASLVSFVS